MILRVKKSTPKNSQKELLVADVKMEIPVLIRSLKSSILSWTSLPRDNTFWGVVSAAVEQSRRKANIVAWGDGKFGSWDWPQNPSKLKKIARRNNAWLQTKRKYLTFFSQKKYSRKPFFIGKQSQINLQLVVKYIKCNYPIVEKWKPGSFLSLDFQQSFFSSLHSAKPVNPLPDVPYFHSYRASKIGRSAKFMLNRTVDRLILML